MESKSGSIYWISRYLVGREKMYLALADVCTETGQEVEMFCVCKGSLVKDITCKVYMDSEERHIHVPFHS